MRLWFSREKKKKKCSWELWRFDSAMGLDDSLCLQPVWRKPNVCSSWFSECILCGCAAGTVSGRKNVSCGFQRTVWCAVQLCLGETSNGNLNLKIWKSDFVLLQTVIDIHGSHPLRVFVFVAKTNRVNLCLKDSLWLKTFLFSWHLWFSV